MARRRLVVMANVNRSDSAPSRQRIGQAKCIAETAIRRILLQVTSIDAGGLRSKGGSPARLRLVSLDPAIGKRRTQEVRFARVWRRCRERLNGEIATRVVLGKSTP